MKIIKLQIENFRLLKKFSIDLEKELSLVIGKNNTGKTSILAVLDKFLNEKSKFSYDDLNIDFKNELESLISSENILEEEFPKGIKLKIFIEYEELDDLSNISRVLMDLDPENNKIVLGFEYTLSYIDFLNLKSDYLQSNKIKLEKKNKKEEIEAAQKNKPRGLHEFLKQKFANYFNNHKMSFEYEKSTQKVNEKNFIDLKNEAISIKDIISFKYISARRDVTNKESEKTLSKQVSTLYKKKEDNGEKTQITENFNAQILETDDNFSTIYKDLFSNEIKKIQNFGGLKPNDTNLEIISNLQHRNLLEGNTTVVYTHQNHKLPEYYNGLGYMNLINIIFEIVNIVEDFKRDKNEKPADINLLIIEEPEAHTHPQMQHIFIKNIKKLLAEGITGNNGINSQLQYIITTHSSHILADSDFDDIKYLKTEGKNNVIAKNLSDLRKQYDEKSNHYQFLKQYLTISRAEIFFADKAILIEGDTERILMPTFMQMVDKECLKEKEDKNNFLPLLSQNISIIEVGAYSQIFENFIEFLGIKSLILTDIDAVKSITNNKEKEVFQACPVTEGTKTSNSAIEHFFKGVSLEKLQTLSIDKRTISRGNTPICICYQQKEKKYYARSFEEAFIHLNREFLNTNKKTFRGLKNTSYFDDSEKNAYELADSCIKKKTYFALDILYHSNECFSNWNIPAYIKNGLLWLKQD